MPLEPSLWYSRFTQFDLLGPTRSIHATYNAERVKASKSMSTSTPRAWTREAALWEWSRRAQAHDAAIQTQASADYEAERLDERLRRINTLKGLRGKALTALNALTITAMDSYAIIAALKLVTQELRKEYNDEPAQRVEHSGTVTGPSIEVRVIDYRAGLMALRPDDADDDDDRGTA